MKQAIERLVTLGLTEIESKVYITFLKVGIASGYKIAKELNLSRCTVYKAIDSLYNAGYLSLIPGNANNEYQAKNPCSLLDELENKYLRNSRILKEELTKIENTQNKDFFINIYSLENVFSKLKELIKSAQKEIFINTDFELNFIKDDLREAALRGVNIVIFSFTRHPEIGKNIKIFSLNEKKFCACNHRIMMICDENKSLVVDNEAEKLIGVFSNNKLMATILYEHIHHDIYLLKLKKKHGILFTKDIFINSHYEKALQKIPSMPWSI